MAFICVLLFFFFKQKTAYEMRISDWSSDVCSSDLGLTLWLMRRRLHFRWQPAQIKALLRYGIPMMGSLMLRYSLDTLCRFLLAAQIGRASCRERVCQYV